MDPVTILTISADAVLVRHGQALTLRTMTRSWSVCAGLHVLDIALRSTALLVMHPEGVTAYPVAQLRRLPDNAEEVQLTGGVAAGPGGPVRAMSSGWVTSAFITPAGRLWLSGMTMPMNLEDPGDTYDGFVDVGGEVVVDVAIGHDAAFAVTHTGRLAAWGNCVNPDSLLGTGTDRSTVVPVFVTEVRDEKGQLQPAPRFAKVSFQKVLADFGSTSLAAIDRSGCLYTTGCDQLIACPTPIRATIPVASVSRRLGACALLADGTVFSSKLGFRVPFLTGICGVLSQDETHAHKSGTGFDLFEADARLMCINAAGHLVVM